MTTPNQPLRPNWFDSLAALNRLRNVPEATPAFYQKNRRALDLALNRLSCITFAILLIGGGASLSYAKDLAVDTIARLKGEAAEGNPRAQLELGFMYSRGNGVSENKDEAVAWFRKAAEQGNAEAQFRLGLELKTGKGEAKDTNAGSGWTRKAAEQGHPRAQLFLGISYASGHGVAIDEKMATIWWQKAADQNVADAQFYLAGCYQNGRGVPKDLCEAYKFYKLSAAQGFHSSIRGSATGALEFIATTMTSEQIAEGQRRAEAAQRTQDRPAESNEYRGRIQPQAYTLRLSSDWEELSPDLVESVDRMFRIKKAPVFISIFHFQGETNGTDILFKSYLKTLDKVGGAPTKVLEERRQGIWKFFQIVMTAKDGYESRIIGYLTSTSKGGYIFLGAMENITEQNDDLVRDAFYGLKLAEEPGREGLGSRPAAVRRP